MKTELQIVRGPSTASRRAGLAQDDGIIRVADATRRTARTRVGDGYPLT
jgi:hypothetical protein